MNTKETYKIHEEGIAYLVSRLEKKGYTTIETNVPYHVKVGEEYVDGEIDVMAIRGLNIHLYEVKYKHSGGKERKARSQLKRCIDTHPNLKMRGIYFTCDGVIKRI